MSYLESVQTDINELAKLTGTAAKVLDVVTAEELAEYEEGGLSVSQCADLILDLAGIH